MRKSPRLLQQKISQSQETKSKNNMVCTSSISSTKEHHFTTPCSSVRKVNLKDRDRNPKNLRNDLVKSVDGLNYLSKSDDGLRKSTRKIDGVEGFQSLRRSPRFASLVSTPELSDKKGRDDKPIRKNSGVFADFSDTETSLVENQKRGLRKTRKRSRGVMGNSRVLEKSEVGVNSVEGGEQKKKGNANGGIGEKRKGNNGKENSDPEVGKRINGTHLWSPLASIKNISEKANYEGNPEKIEEKMIISVKSRTGRVNGVEEIQSLRRSSRISNLPNTHSFVCNDFLDKEIFPAVTPKVEGEKKRMLTRGIQENGEKRKNNHIEENLDSQGWTKDQELALQRAYFAAKPSPLFWKKVSKMVPGKSAQDCFDKIHSDLVTPPQPQPRSRAKKPNSSPLGHFSLSGSKLLEPTELNVKWPKHKTQKKLHAQKTLRHLVQKRLMVDQCYEADLFLVLEPITNAPTQGFSQTKIPTTPENVSDKNGFVQDCHDRSSSSSHQKKPLSRFRNSCQTALISPPVLKQVKNRALHEKYIDQLHCREARRMAGKTKYVNVKEDNKENHVKKMDDVTVARNALIFEAKDMISKFQEVQANVTSDCEDSQSGDDYDGEDDEDIF